MSSSSNNSKFKCNHSSQKKSKWTKIGSRKANGKAKGFKPQKQPVQPREGLVQPRELSNRFEYLSEELSDESHYFDEYPAVGPVSRRLKSPRKKKSYKAVARILRHGAKKRVPEVSKPQSSEEEDSFLFAASGEGHHGYASPEQGPVQTKIGPSSGKSNSLSSYRPTQHSGRRPASSRRCFHRKKKSYKATLKRVQRALLPRQSSRLTQSTKPAAPEVSKPQSSNPQYSRKRTAGEDTAVIKTEALASSFLQKRRRTSYLQPIDLVSSSDEDADSGEEDNPTDDPIPANNTDDAASEQASNSDLNDHFYHGGELQEDNPPDDPIPANYTDDAASEQSYHGCSLIRKS